MRMLLLSGVVVLFFVFHRKRFSILDHSVQCGGIEMYTTKSWSLFILCYNRVVVAWGHWSGAAIDEDTIIWSFLKDPGC